MKVIIFKASSIPEFLIKDYNGHHTSVKYYDKCEVANLINKPIENMVSNIQDARVIEDTYTVYKVKSVISTEPHNFIAACANIFNNLKSRGNATIAIDFIIPLYDIITYLSLCFKSCKIVFSTSYYLELTDFKIPKKKSEFIMCLRYYMDHNLSSMFITNPDRDILHRYFSKKI